MGGGPSKKQRSTKLQQQNTTTTDDEAQWIGLGDDDSRAADRQNKESINLPRRRSESVDLSVRSSGTDYEEEQVDSEASTNADDEEDKVVEHAEDVPNQWPGCGESANWTWSDGKRQYNRACDSDTGQ